MNDFDDIKYATIAQQAVIMLILRRLVVSGLFEASDIQEGIDKVAEVATRSLDKYPDLQDQAHSIAEAILEYKEFAHASPNLTVIDGDKDA